MDKGTNIDFNVLKILYAHYKKIIIPSFAIFISLFIFIKFIIPQIEGLILIKQETKASYDRVNILKNNLQTLTSLNDSDLDNTLQIVTKALPTSKDFNGILNALSVVSLKTGASLGNFSFQVGDLSVFKDTGGKYLFLKLSLNVSGDTVIVNNFINAINNTLPLSQIVSVEMSDKNSSMTILFYYKPLPPIVYSNKSPVPTISKKDFSLIEKLSSFNNPSPSLAVPSVVSSGSVSANPL